MSELALTLLRLAFLALLWCFVLATVLVLRRDLRAPREARPVAVRVARGDAAKAERPAKQPKQPKAPKAPKVRGASLLVTEGALTGTVLPLTDAAVTIGRAPDSTLMIDDDYVSSRHARLYPAADGTWIVEDLGSTNGTWIDRTRLTAPAVLPVSAPLRIGRTTLQLRK